MKKIIIIVSAFLISCSSSNITEQEQKEPQKQDVFKEYPKATDIKLNFLDDYVFPPKQMLKNTEIGGLSGIDNNNGTYYLICDDYKNPRFYKAKINIKNNKIENVKFEDVVVFNDVEYPFFRKFLDLESIIFQDDKVVISSEGSIKRGKNPSVFQVDTNGKFITEFQLTEKFLANSKEKPRHNGVFEGLSKSFDNQGFWVANELPLEADGTEPKFPKTNSPVRFTYYDKRTKKPIKEFIYELSPLARKEKGSFNINGLTDILEYKKNHFLVIERTYQNGYKGNENLAKIYKATIEENTTNSLNINNLKENKYIPLKKELVFDFSTIKQNLKQQIIDNIEGISFGEKLPNGNQSLIIISDDNFQKFGKQINQFILFEIENN